MVVNGAETIVGNTGSDPVGGDGLPGIVSNEDLNILNAEDTVEEKPDADLDDLNQADDESDDDSKDESDKEEDTDDEDESESEDQDKVEEEKKSAVSEAEARVKLAEIKAKYPTLLKEHPELKAAIYRDHEYGKLFANPEQAKHAVRVVEGFEQFQGEFASGDPEVILGSMHDANPEAVDRFASEFLPTLYRANEKLFEKITTPIVFNIIRNIAAMGERDNNYAIAAKYFAHALTGSYAIPELPTESKQPDDPEKVALRQQLSELSSEKMRNFAQGLTNDVNLGVTKLINDEIGSLIKSYPQTVKNAILSQIDSEIKRVMQNDRAHKNEVLPLLQQEEKAGFTGEKKSRITTAYLERAKHLLPAIVAKAKADLTPKRNVETDDEEETAPVQRKKIPQSGAVGGRKNSVPHPRSIDWNKTSDMAILNDNVAVKR